MKVWIKHIDLAWSIDGERKTIHIVSIEPVTTFSEARQALTLFQELKQDLNIQKSNSPHDCTGKYSTQSLEVINRSIDFGILSGVILEYGTLNI